MLTKKLRIVGLLLLLTLFVSSVSVAAPLTSNATTMPRAASTGAFGSNEVPAGKSPTTGRDWQGEYRPLLVQISNSHEARPHWNISEADIVYESILWGPGHTRYSAVFSDNHPSFVGSVRSARQHHCELREEWDCPFVFFGGQEAAGTSIYDFFRLNNVTKDFLFDGVKSGTYSKGYSRDSTRVSPHNAVANLELMLAEAWPTKEDGSPYVPKMHAFKFSQMPSRGSDTAVEIHVVYDEKDYYPHYTYNAEKRVYERWYNGEEQYDAASNKRIEAANVIVQFCETSYFQQAASRPVISTVHGGTMDAFIDGRHIRGTWERKSLTDRTVFLDMNGEEITLLPGVTYIQIIPTSADFKYIRADGEEFIMDIGSDVPEPDFIDNEDINALDQMAGEG